MTNYARIREEASKLNPIDDIFFQVMAEDKSVCQEILQTILEDSELVVLNVTPQRELRNLQGRSVRLDAECILGTGQHAGIEIQKQNNDDHQRRVRYNAACLTTNITNTGVKFKEVPDIIIVYISRFDIFGEKRTTYHINRVIQETGNIVYNGQSEIYVNTEHDDGTRTSDLMKIFTQDNCYDEKNFPHISSRKRYLKETRNGVILMSNIVEKLLKEERLEGIRTGRMEGKTDTLVQLVQERILSIQDAASRLSISEEDFIKILNKQE